MSKLVDIENPTKGSATKSAFYQRRKFLELPLEKRREILKAQALNARAYYTQAKDWREWQSADLSPSE
jgi:hypothetical protein